MNKICKKMAGGAAALAMTVSLFVPAGSLQAASAVKVKGIEMKNPSGQTLALKKGEKFSLKVSVTPKKAKNSIAFSSSKKKVVQVSKKGVLKAKKAGTATITAASTTKPKKKAKVKVTVYKKLTKVKKVSFDKTSAAIEEGGSLALKTTVAPANATVKKVAYSTSQKSVATVSKAGVVTAKKAGTADITAYAQDGRGAKAVCRVTVQKKGEGTPQPGSAAPAASASPGPGTSSSAGPATQKPQETFVIASASESVPVYVDEKGKDYDGLSLIAESFAGDVALVAQSGKASKVVSKASELGKTAIIAGSIGNNDVIDSLIAEGKLDVSDIQGKWEVYKIQFVTNPTAGVDKAIVVAGSDKRGTIYGLYHISEAMGVSPWVYWGDAVPEKKSEIAVTNWDLEMTSKEPSVKYRGIFLNDEAPSLTGWVSEKFGKKGSAASYNEEFYKLVYEVLLRCKGNYLWPAMWSNTFSEDGKATPIANAELADKYGVIMGTSHHEPLCRAGEEWGRVWKEYTKDTTKKYDWNFNVNEEAITNFWKDGVTRNKAFENVYTLGMRGEADSELEGGMEENIDLLKRVITTQKQILAENNLSGAPKVLTVYKEVENYWHGNDDIPGLKKWDQLDDVMIMLCEDNNGNMRTLPTTKEEQERKGGWGMYYHFDFHGGPTSYEWVNTKELNKVWEQMTMAYEHGIDDMWIVNVGDLKPMEMNISYFLDMAYDYETWGENGRNKTGDYMKQWVKQQFGSALNEEQTEGVASLLKEYTWINGSCNPETLKKNTYHVTNYNEAVRVLKRAQKLMDDAETYKKIIPDRLQAAYFELVYYPAVASANVAKMQILSGLNEYFYGKGSSLANVYGEQLQESIELDKTLEYTYNNEIPGVGDKWKNMMSSPHVGYVTWDSKGWSYPQVKDLQFPDSEDNGMIVTLQNQDAAYKDGECALDPFTSVNKETYTVTVSNSGATSFDYTVAADADWIKLSKTSGKVAAGDTFEVSVDWDKVKSDASGTVTVKGAVSSGSAEVKIQVSAKVYDVSSLEDHTYVYANGYASMLAGGYVNSGDGAGGISCGVIHNYGKMGQSAKAFPSNFCFADDVESAPYMEYKVFVEQAGTYKFTVYAAPSNNVDRDDVAIRYGVSVNGGSTEVVNMLDSSKFAAGEYSGSWAGDVAANGRKKATSVTLEAGVNTIRVYAVDPTLVLQKLVVSEKDVLASHLGPEESYYTGK